MSTYEHENEGDFTETFPEGLVDKAQERIAHQCAVLIAEGRDRNEVVAEKAQRWMDMLVSIHVPAWRLSRVSGSFRSGVSVYGFYRKELPNGEYVERKVRISDHVGRWSEFHLDLRNPKNADSIQALLSE